MQTEYNALNALLDQSNDDVSFDSVMDDVTVQNGFETALGVALGADLQAGFDDSAPFYWADRSKTFKLGTLPKGSKPLLDVVTAPKSLHTALSQVGVVENTEQGNAAAKDLQPGQVLVTKDGHAWRWDGLTVTPAASSILQTKTAEERLKQRNYLTKLHGDIATAQEKRARRTS